MDIYGVSSDGAANVSAAQKIAHEICAGRAGSVDEAANFPEDGISALKKAGLMGLCVAKEHGGQGQGPRTFAAVVEEIAQSCGSTAMIYVMHVTASQAIAASTSPNKDALLKQIAAGQHLTTLAFSEKASRSNFWLPASKLEKNGSGYTTNAFKSWVTSARHADSYVSSAQAPGAKSPLESTIYLAKPKGAGINVNGTFNGLGLRGNDSAPVSIEKYAVSDEDLLSAHGKGLDMMLGVVLPWFNIGTSAMAAGLCRAAIAATAGHLSSAGMEGSKLRDLPNLRARLAEMSVRTEQTRALLSATIGLIEKPVPETPLYVLQARLSALQAAVDVTDLGMKTCGGAAFSKHLPLERLFRDARAGWVMAPTVDHLQDFIGKALTGLPLV